MEKFLDKIFASAYAVFFGTFFTSLFIFEYFDFSLINSEFVNGIFNLINLVVSLLMTLLTFFAVLSLHRLDKLQGDKSSSQEIRKQLRAIGKLTLLFIFTFLLVLIVSLSNKSQIFQYEFILRLDRIILSVVISFSAYIFLSAGMSYLSNPKPKDN